MKKIILTFFLVCSSFVFSQTTELNTKGNYVWSASDEAKNFKGKFQMSFVSANQGFPSFGTVLSGGGYNVAQDGGVFQLYFPYSSQYGGVAPRVRMGKYNNAGWTDWATFYTSANANNAATDWNTKRLIADGAIESKGTLSLRSSSAALGDIISLYGNRLGLISNYGFGVESGALYSKSYTFHRWYIGRNADNGVNAKMELSNDRLYVNSKVGIGTKTPRQTLDVNGIAEIGDQATSGGVFLAQQYAGNDYIGTLSSNYSSGAIIMGYGAAGMKSEGTSGQLVSTFDNFTANRGALRVGKGTLEFISTNSAVNTQVGEQLDVSSRFFINDLGNVGIGTATPDSKLAVNGTIHAKEVKVDLVGWPDYVFETSYNLPSLKEVEKHIQEKGHLQNIPSAKEVEKEGVQLGEMNKKLLEKIEELTLYTIQQEKRIEKLESKNSELINQNKKIQELEEKLNKLLSKK